MWETYVEPNLKAQEEITRAAGGAEPPRVGRDGWVKPKPRGGSFDPARLSKDEMAAFLDRFCGKKKYTGPRWWLGEGGAQVYDGER